MSTRPRGAVAEWPALQCADQISAPSARSLRRPRLDIPPAGPWKTLRRALSAVPCTMPGWGGLHIGPRLHRLYGVDVGTFAVSLRGSDRADVAPTVALARVASNTEFETSLAMP
eukprot:7729392-Pyramimonas_sp.AAC.1